MKDPLPIDSFEGLIGATPAMRRVFEDARKIAKTRLPVLIIGEVGTGRRSLARAIHEVSGGEKKQFMMLADYGEEKKASLEDETLMKVLEKGKAGTLYIEEITDLSPAEQFALEEYLKSSASAGEESNARLIVATSVDLENIIKAGKFRSDLYFLFLVMKLPPLRERRDDVIPSVELFCKIYSEIHGKKQLKLHPQVVAEIMRHSWPGNVIELENRIRRAVIMGEKERIMPTDLGLELKYDEVANEIIDFKKAREKFEKEFLEKAMARNRSNIMQVAQETGMTRPTIYGMMRKYDPPR